MKEITVKTEIKIVANGTKCSLRCQWRRGSNPNHTCEIHGRLKTAKDGYPYRADDCIKATALPASAGEEERVE
jgi:hypothetical protein